MLPDLNCIAEYTPDFMSVETADALFELLMRDEALTKPQVIRTADSQFELDYGKAIYLDPALFSSGAFPQGECYNQSAWTNPLADLSAEISKVLKQRFPVCVAIYYPDGSANMDYHRDYRAFGDVSHLASISLGAERMFSLREVTTGITHDTKLAHGSLFYMGPGCQEQYEHALLPDASCTSPRINLTFRLFGEACSQKA